MIMMQAVRSAMTQKTHDAGPKSVALISVFGIFLKGVGTLWFAIRPMCVGLSLTSVGDTTIALRV